MNRVSIRSLRNEGGKVIERVLAGESITVTRSGTPVAELGPVRRRGIDRETLLRRWKMLPQLDLDEFRRDLDAVLDPSL